MHDFGFLIVLLLAVIALVALAHRLPVPWPVILLIGGVAVAWIPGVPIVRVAPDLSLVIFLAPVLFQAGFTTSWRDFRANIVPIGMLAIGAVLVTMLVVGAVSRQLFPGMPWAVALTLGAIIAPPDAIAATSVFDQVGVPRRMRTIVEGESLVNDASALIAYQFAVGAIVSGRFSARDAALGFVLVGTLSVGAGIVLGWLLTRLLPLIEEPSLTIALTLIVPMPIYLVANRVGLSGVLMVVAAAIVVGHFSTRSLSPEARLGGHRVWSTVLIVLNGLVFLLIGLEFAEALREMPGGDVTPLFGKALVISGVVIAARFAWVLGSKAGLRLVPGRHQNSLPWRDAIAISWSGLRGIVSIALALALPFALDDGSPFAWRRDVVFAAFVVIVVTLLGEGLTLPWLLRVLKIQPGTGELREEWTARRVAAQAALDRLGALQNEPWVDPVQRDVLRTRYRHLLDIAPREGELPEEERKHVAERNRLRTEILDAARRAVVAARDRGDIGDDARLQVEAELDLEDERTIL